MHLVIAPHLDDAVLSCGCWLAAHPGSMVLTLFAGVPRDGAARTEWDARCGFACAAEAVAARRREDAQALALLGAVPRWLDFADGQYGDQDMPDAVATAVRAVLAEAAPCTLLYPLGLHHADHRRAHGAVVAALQGQQIATLRGYEDVPYRAMPGVLQQRLAELAAAGVRATPAREAPPRTGGAAKARALRAYVSQARAFDGGWPDAALPERYWELERAAV